MGLQNGTARRSLGDLVFERMHRAIKSGAYKPDERLPTEHDLAIEFEVSRPVIREALRRLREQGFIYSRRGAGSFVRALAPGRSIDRRNHAMNGSAISAA